MSELFNVFWWAPDGSYYKEGERLEAEAAVKLAHSLTVRPAAQMGVIRKVMITDGGDCCCFMWEHGKGVTHK